MSNRKTVTIQDVYRYYTPSEADNLTEESLYDLLNEPYDEDGYERWQTLNDLKRRLGINGYKTLEIKAGLMLVPLWILIISGTATLGFWLLYHLRTRLESSEAYV